MSKPKYRTREYLRTAVKAKARNVEALADMRIETVRLRTKACVELMAVDGEPAQVDDA